MYKKSKVNTVIGFERITRDIERIAFGMNFKVINSIPKQKYLCHTRDKKDDRILDAAICGNMDAVLTGDKDLIEFRCNKIKILNIHQ
jgi:putative PIN family toxin of toxin-antitoxin system